MESKMEKFGEHGHAIVAIAIMAAF